MSPSRIFAVAAFSLSFMTAPLAAAEPIDFEKQIKPILERSCLKCHNESRAKGELRLETAALALEGGDSGPAIVPGKPDESALYERITLPADDPAVMPAGSEPLPKAEIELIHAWIAGGAKWPETVVLKAGAATRTAENTAGLPITDEENAAVAKVRERGALAIRIAQNSNWLRVDFGLGVKDLTDADLAALAQMPNLYSLGLANTSVTDAGLAHLRDAKNLRTLHLEKTKITDEGLKHLANLQELEYLNVYGTEVTDAGLEHLKGLKKLSKLYLWQTKVSDEGVKKLQAELPDLYVNRGILNTEVADAAEEKKEPAKEEEKK